jgi:gluconolactonase
MRKGEPAFLRSRSARASAARASRVCGSCQAEALLCPIRADLCRRLPPRPFGRDDARQRVMERAPMISPFFTSICREKCRSDVAPRLSLALLLVSAMAGSACGNKAGAAPEPESPEAPVAAAESDGANVGSVTTPAPAAARELPTFCSGAADAPPPSSSARPERIKDGFVFVEGAVWSAELGAFLFSEMDFEHQGKNGPPSKIHRLVLPAAVDVFIADAGSNGLAIDGQGLVACTHDTQTLSRYDLTSKARSVFAADYQGKHFNSPNDVALHSAGYAYFTDPDWQIGERPNQTGVTGVYLRKPSGEVVLIDGTLDKPNGVTLSPDETKLYVGSKSGVIEVYQVLADGNVTGRQAFAEVKEPDGMAVDCAGRLFVASHSAGELVVLSPEGKQLSAIKVGPRATNVAFGGPDRKTILITAGSSLYTLRSDTPGFPY